MACLPLRARPPVPPRTPEPARPRRHLRRLRTSWTFEDLTALSHVTVVADLRCATGPTSTDHGKYGIPTTAVLDLMPPAPEVTLAWAEFRHSVNLRRTDFTSPGALLATHHNGEPLTAGHGFPLRLVEPHLFDCKSPKWLRGIEYLSVTPTRNRKATVLGCSRPGRVRRECCGAGSSSPLP
ncbi:molybdopterin-dependent oxidoreductase [Streptomyces sp. NPDC058457]|uniref:molybdopterin-dependent oxidoreductase n=1 Tax=Streptomyces sp. NPDC058457 TaxID=3346507 RepID=UPI00364B66FC